MTRVNNSRISSLPLIKLDVRFNNCGINVGGTAEVFSSLNLVLGDFVIFAGRDFDFHGQGLKARSKLKQNR